MPFLAVNIDLNDTHTHINTCREIERKREKERYKISTNRWTNTHTLIQAGNVWIEYTITLIQIQLYTAVF